MFQFPASPTEGQIFAPAGGPQYVYRAPYWRASGRVDAIVAETPPAGPKNGQLWFNSSTGNTYIWYEDPNSAQWVQINVGPGGSSNRVLYSSTFAGTTLADRVNAAIAEAEDGDTVDGNEGGSHTVTTTITVLDKGINLNLGTTTIVVNANVNGLKAYSTPAGPWALTANYAIGSTTLAVATMDRAPNPGEWFTVVSDAIDPANRESGASASQYRVAERFQANGGTTTSITLKYPLRFTNAVEEDGTKIASYTTAKNTRLIRHPERQLRINGGIFVWPPGQAWVTSGLLVRGYVRPSVTNTVLDGPYGVGFQFAGCMNGDFTSLTARNQRTAAAYGVDFAGDTRSRLSGFTGFNCHHTVTDNSENRPAAETNLELVVQTGRSVGTLISGNVSYGSTNASFDTHHGASDWVLRDNYAEGSAGWAASFRGINNRIDGFTARNCASGVQVFTEFGTGDRFVSGKPEGITSATIGNLDIECTGVPVDASQSKLKLFGYNRLVSNNITAIYAGGGSVDVYGSVDHLVCAPATDAVGHSLFECLAQHGSLGADFGPQINFMHNSVVRSDLSAVTASGADCSIFYADPSAVIRLHGAMELVIPAAITAKYRTTMSGSTSIVHGEAQRMQITGPGAAALDITRRGYNVGHFAFNDKSDTYDFRAKIVGLAADTVGTANFTLAMGWLHILVADTRTFVSVFAPAAASFTVIDPTASATEYIAVATNDFNSKFVFLNAHLTTANVAAGQIGVAFIDGVIEVMVRMAQPAPLTAFIQGWGTRL